MWPCVNKPPRIGKISSASNPVHDVLALDVADLVPDDKCQLVRCESRHGARIEHDHRILGADHVGADFVTLADVEPRDVADVNRSTDVLQDLVQASRRLRRDLQVTARVLGASDAFDPYWLTFRMTVSRPGVPSRAFSACRSRGCS